METRRGLLLIAALDLLVMTIGITGAVGVKLFLGLFGLILGEYR